MYCRECGKPLLESDKFCSNCGTPVKKITPSEEPMFRTEGGDKKERKATAPLPSFKTEEPEEETKSERMIFEAIGDSIKWDTDIFPDRTPKKTEDVDFHWNVGDDEFRNRPARTRSSKLSTDRSEPSLWSDMGAAAPEKPKSTGLKPSDTNSWDELFEGTRSDDKNTRKAPSVGRNSIEAYWEDMFRRDGADKKVSDEKPSHRVSISREDIERGMGDEGSERLDQNKLEETMTLSREEMEDALREGSKEKAEKPEKKETRENREVAELASLAAAGIGAGPTFVPEGTVAVTLPEDGEAASAPKDKTPELTGEELERELFRDMEEPMTEAQKMRARQTEKIDKFYTFNKKNEEFQKLLDQEYERFKKNREQQDLDDLGADLYKLGDENFFEDFSNEGASQALEMARARQTLFHDDDYSELLRDRTKEEPAAEEAVAEELAAPEEAPSEELFEESAPAPEAAPLAEDVAEAPAKEPEEPVSAGSRREKKHRKRLFERLFGRDTTEIESAEVAAAAGVAGAALMAEEAAAAEEPKEELTSEEPKEELAAEEPAEESAEAAATPVEEEPAEDQVEGAAEELPDEEAEEPAEEFTAEEPAEELAAEEPAEELAAEEPVEETAEEFVAEPAEEPVEESAEELPDEEAEEPAEELAAEEPAEEINLLEEIVPGSVEEPITASIVFEPEEEEPEEAEALEGPEESEAPEEPEGAQEPAEAEEPEEGEEQLEIPAAEEPAAEEPAAEEPAQEEEQAVEEPEEPAPEPVRASIVYDPVTQTQETIVTPAPTEETVAEEAAEEVSSDVPRTTEPTRIYEKGDIPAPTTAEERATAFEENRAAAWDAFFSDDEEMNAGNTFDAENDEEPREEEEKGGASVAASILAVILVLILALIVVRLVLPDSILSVKLDQFVEMILNLFNGNIAATLFNHIL